MRIHMKALATAALATLPWLAPTAQAGYFLGPETYHECILDRLDGLSDDAAAVNALVACRNEFSPLAPEPPPDPWFFEPQNLKECLQEHLPKTTSPFAVSQIQDACLMWYPDSGESFEIQ
jgi:hypothetical protein